MFHEQQLHLLSKKKELFKIIKTQTLVGVKINEVNTARKTLLSS